ncbi:hypothetical protein SDRG_00428 [Saprolegnia diclina VS20]|uniref:Uncharacterized protein n=1 Tax=Saprolegnia diclina (strain VS20) TaxID=1156394 RepID=T0R6Z1_SAPDV|nr:hypothetical protein SDRG_00428 [Saprolegnia diclina VS20]EQC42701.1 hypothetical protein SDRG_00428 [Saprolegnia diclina VS20]|eukprot:XP_008604124.1 hypothetical protein SDRG_00428 [Saprolegnia diclina VS20]
MAARRLADDAATTTPAPSAIVELANATATPSPPLTDANTGADSTTLILAIVLGVLGLGLLVGMSLLWCKRRRRTHRQQAHETYFKATTTNTNSNEDGYNYGRRAAPYTMDTYPIQLSEYQPSMGTESAPAADMYYASNDSPAVLPPNYSRKIAMRGRPASFAGSGVSEDSSIVSNSERESETEWTTKLIKLHHQSTSSASSSSAVSSSSSSPREIVILHDPNKSMPRESDGVRYGDSMFSQPSLGHTFARGSNAFRVSSFSYDLSPSLLDTNGSTVIMETTSQTSRESYDI